MITSGTKLRKQLFVGNNHILNLCIQAGSQWDPLRLKENSMENRENSENPLKEDIFCGCLAKNGFQHTRPAGKFFKIV